VTGVNRCEDAMPGRVSATVTSSTIKSVTTSTRFVHGRKIVTKKYVYVLHDDVEHILRKK